MAGYSIDNIDLLLESRESARRRTTNFEAIFHKYDKEFEFDDEIDIHNETICTDKGFIRGKERVFGSSRLATTKRKEERLRTGYGSDDETKYKSQLSFANPEIKVEPFNNTDPEIWKDLMESFVHDPGNEPSDAETISSATSSSSEITDDEAEESSVDEFDDLNTSETDNLPPFLGEENTRRDEWYSLKKCNKYIPPTISVPDRPLNYWQNVVREPKQTGTMKRINPCPVPETIHMKDIVSIQPVGMIRPIVDRRLHENQEAHNSPFKTNNYKNVSQALHQFQNVCSNETVSMNRQGNDKTILPTNDRCAIVSDDFMSITHGTSQNLTWQEKQKFTNEGQSDFQLSPSKNLEGAKYVPKALRRHLKPKKMLNERSRIRCSSKDELDYFFKAEDDQKMILSSDVGITMPQTLPSNNEPSLPKQRCDKITQFGEMFDKIKNKNSLFKNNLHTNISKTSLQSPPKHNETFIISKNQSPSFSHCGNILSHNSKASPSICMASLKLNTKSPSRMIKTSTFQASVEDFFGNDLTPCRRKKNLMIEKSMEANYSGNRERLVIKTKDDMIFSKRQGNVFLSTPPLVKSNSLDLIASPPRCRSRQRPQQRTINFDSTESSSNSLIDEDCSLNQKSCLQTQFEKMFQSLFPQGLVDEHTRNAQQMLDKNSSPLKTSSKKVQVQTVASPFDRMRTPKVPCSQMENGDCFSPSKEQAKALIMLEEMMSFKNVQRNLECQLQRTSSLSAKETETCSTTRDITTTSTDTLPLLPFNSNRIKPRSSPKRPLSRSLESESDINMQNNTGSSPQKERRIVSSVSHSKEQIVLKTANSVTQDGFVVPQSIHMKKLQLNKNKEKLPPTHRACDEVSDKKHVNSSVYDWKSDSTLTNCSQSRIINRVWYQSYKGPFHTSTPMKRSIPQNNYLDTSISSICSEIPNQKEM